MLNDITPIILTYDEALNINRTLSALSWAKDIVVVDSGSTDDTLKILQRDSRIRVHHRLFDSHAEQWRFAIHKTGVKSQWVIRLDADYIMTDDLIREIAALDPKSEIAAYRVHFAYAIHGRMLRASLYPPNTILFRPDCVTVENRGHTEIWKVSGNVRDLSGKVIHDDRKAMRGWTASQGRYMAREIETLDPNARSVKSFTRLHPPLAPFAVFFYVLFAKGLILDGRAGLFYALQRLLAETALSLMVLERDMQEKIEEDDQR